MYTPVASLWLIISSRLTGVGADQRSVLSALGRAPVGRNAYTGVVLSPRLVGMRRWGDWEA